MGNTATQGRTPLPVRHAMGPDAALAALETRPEGLSAAEAAARLAAHGPNELEASGRASPWSLLLAQFKNVLILILMVAVGLSALLGHTLEAVVIAVILLFAVVLGFVQEYRAERTMAALKRLAAAQARVLRGGQPLEIPAAALVPGDLVLFEAGTLVPADLRLVEAAQLRRIMMHVHTRGRGVCGVYPYEVAETKVALVHERAKENGFPLRAAIEEA